MKTNVVVVLACLCLLLLFNGVHVDARRHRDQQRSYKLLLFGDSFVDNGNRQATEDRTKVSRQWYTPYGMSDSAHGYRPTGRFSNGLVQSDFLAKIVGLDKSAPAYRLWMEEDDDGSQFTGLNFAVGGSSVYNGTEVVPSLRMQTDQLRDLVLARDVSQEDVDDSVALIAVSGLRDYKVLKEYYSDDEFRSFTDQLTDRIVDGVRRLQRLGVSKVLVNAVPPFGCMPWRSWANYYHNCDARGNVLSAMHNAALRQKLARLDGVFLLDLEGIFNNVFSDGTDLSRQFPTRFTPCCDSPDPDHGYCGKVDDDKGTRQYTVCRNPGDYFYWDFDHPTQAGWKAVMDALNAPIKDFLGI